MADVLVEVLDDFYKTKRCQTFILMCGATAVAVDPLFLYSIVINDDTKCLRVDKKLGAISTALRSVTDFFYVIPVIFKLSLAIKRRDARAIAKTILIDFLSVLPIPQVVLLIISPQVIDIGANLLILLVFLQYVPRVLRICPSFRLVIRTHGILIGSAALNLYFYMLSCHVVGAFWYLFAIIRKTRCWQEACQNRIGCVRLSCDAILEDYTFLTDSCPIKTPNATIFNFGIFIEALDSGIVDSTDFFQKFFYSFWFGLQSLSCLGQNLTPSTYLLEIFFAIIVTILGLMMFLVFIGNVQTYLQYKVVTLVKTPEKIRMKQKEIDRWMCSYNLHLDQQNITKYLRQTWLETRGCDVENLFRILPKEIKRYTMRPLCEKVLRNVPEFQNVDGRLLILICDRLKPVSYIKQSYIVREGDPLCDMLFIIQGTLLTYTSTSGKCDLESRRCLQKGDFYGEELIHWAVNSSSLIHIPVSAKTVHALTMVKAWALEANDLNSVVFKFRHRFPRNAPNTIP